MRFSGGAPLNLESVEKFRISFIFGLQKNCYLCTRKIGPDGPVLYPLGRTLLSVRRLSPEVIKLITRNHNN